MIDQTGIEAMIETEARKETEITTIEIAVMTGEIAAKITEIIDLKAILEIITEIEAFLEIETIVEKIEIPTNISLMIDMDLEIEAYQMKDTQAITTEKMT